MIPKFRVWDTVKESMSEVQAIVYVEEKIYPIYSKVIRRYIPFNEAILMQYTGLKDKNGKEIFEGDILKCTSFDGSFWYETVSWDSTLAGFATQQNGYDATAISYITDSKAITVEIIGDIYQNPELLEEK
ncbi:TPA: YopX family protein [Streptococcus suis]